MKKQQKIQKMKKKGDEWEKKKLVLVVLFKEL